MNYIDNRCFVDTNIFLYSLDIDSPNKQKIAQEIIKNLWQKGYGYLEPV